MMDMSSTQLIDRFQRRIDYVRVSVTDRCDLRCSYCLPKGFKDYREPAHWLTFDEIARVVAAFGRLGVQRIRLTGGEPLLRHDLAGLAARLKALPGICDLSLSSNATQLGKHAEALKASGIDRLNISLDSLRRDRIMKITGRDSLEAILEGIEAARTVGFAPIKINMVAMRGINDDEFEQMTEFCMEKDLVLRLIETMPMGESGRNAEYLDLQPVKARLQRRFNLVEAVFPGGGPARYLRASGGRFSIGFITPISQHFCASCNRVRLGVDGMLYMCLGQNESVALRPLLRNGASDADLEEAISAAIDSKPERHEFIEQPDKIVRFMSATGG